MPAFNRARYLAEAIHSVLDQTFTDYELIVVDDGSTDGTAAVIAGFRDERLRVLRQEHRGISAAMNAGLRAARGEYIARLDSDDVWFPHLLECQTAILDSCPDAGVVYARAQAMSAAGMTREYYLGLPLRYPDDALLSLAWGDPTCNITALARRSCFEAAGLYDEALRTHEDWDMWLRVGRHCRFVFLDRTLARFREHDGRITSLDAPGALDHIESRVRVLDKLFASPGLPSRVRAFRRTAYRNVHTEAGLFLLTAGYPMRALRAFGRAIAAGGNPLVTSLRILWFMTAVRTLTRFGPGRRLLRLQAGIRRRWRSRTLVGSPAARPPQRVNPWGQPSDGSGQRRS